MTIGPDIEEVLDEVGTSYKILRDSGDLTGEKTYFKANSQVTKPFIREFFLEAWFPYNTLAVGGDYVQFITTGDIYIVMNITPMMFEDSIIKYDVVLYKCNVVLDILRPYESDNWDSNYQKLTTWQMVKGQVYGLLTTPLYGHDLVTDEELGYLGLEVHELYLPESLRVQTLDRIRLTSTSYYRVETIKPRRYEGVDVFEVGEDSRPAPSTTTTSTSSTTSTTTSTTTTTA